MSIITVSRQYGSLGKEIAQITAKNLGYTFLDKDSLESQSGKYGIPNVKFDKFDEKNPSFFEYFKSGKDRYLRYLKTSIYENSKDGKALICGRGAHILLQGIPGVLRIRIISSMEKRIIRVSEKLQCDEKNAEKIILHNDRERNGFHKFFYEQKWKDSSLYDVVLNTDHIDRDRAVKMIKDLNAQFSAKYNKDELKSKLLDRYIAQEVIISLLYEHNIPIDILEVTCKQGSVLVKGTVTVEQNIEQCKKAALKVDGVKDVETEIYFITNYMGY